MCQVTSMLNFFAKLLNVINVIVSTKEGMLAYMKDQNMPWIGLSFDSPLGEQLRTNFKLV